MDCEYSALGTIHQECYEYKNPGTVTHIALISLVFYITFAFNNVIDSIFYGIGKTNYMLFQSVVINGVFYGTLFILYVTDIYKPSLELIALMFAGGIAFDSLLTYGMFVWVLRKRKIELGGRWGLMGEGRGVMVWESYLKK